jgi:hypothetical protein
MRNCETELCRTPTKTATCVFYREILLLVIENGFYICRRGGLATKLYGNKTGGSTDYCKE